MRACVYVVGRVRSRVGPLLPIVVTIFLTDDYYVASGHFVAMGLTGKFKNMNSSFVLILELHFGLRSS